MVKQLDILDALSSAMAEALPDLKRIYTDIVPQNFVRPCLLIEAVTTTSHAANCQTLDTTSYYTLTIFDVVDEYSHSDTKRLLQWQAAVIDLFRCGYLHVKDRALRVEVSTGGRNWDKIYIDLELSYFESRDNAVDETPLIENVETELSMKG